MWLNVVKSLSYPLYCCVEHILQFLYPLFFFYPAFDLSNPINNLTCIYHNPYLPYHVLNQIYIRPKLHLTYPRLVLYYILYPKQYPTIVQSCICFYPIFDLIYTCLILDMTYLRLVLSYILPPKQ